MNDIVIQGIEIEDLVTIGHRMVNAHSETETINTAIDLYLEDHPEVDRNVLALLWVGINCKDREHIDQ